MITITNNLKIHHKGSKILLAQCLVTGRFVKHSLALSALMFSNNELFKTKLVVVLCVLMNVFVCVYLGSV